MLNSIKRDIIIKLHYEIDFEKLNKLMPIQTIIPSDTVKEMVKKDIEDYFADDIGYQGIEIEIIDAEDQSNE